MAAGHQSQRKASENGFTLLEVLVALSVFAVMASMAYGGLQSVIKSRAEIEKHSLELGRLQRVFNQFNRDIEQTVDRSVRDQFGTPLKGFVLLSNEVNPSLELTKIGLTNPAHLKRSTLQRIGYLLDDDKLSVLRWPVLDRAQSTEPTRQVLMDQVDALEYRFLADDKNWYTGWPPLILGAPVADLPIAVEVTIVTESLGRVSRLFRLADG